MCYCNDIKIQFISNERRRELESKLNGDSNIDGLYFFDIRDSEGTDYLVERNVFANNIGSLVSNFDLLKYKEKEIDEEFVTKGLDNKYRRLFRVYIDSCELDDLGAKVVYDLV